MRTRSARYDRSVPALAILVVILLAGCPYVPAGEIRVVAGSVAPGETATLGLFCDGLFGGPALAAGGTTCAGGAWGVEDPDCGDGACEIEGGNEALGVIDACGLYTAPTVQPTGPIVIVATECDSLSCADACAATLALDVFGDAP